MSTAEVPSTSRSILDMLDDMPKWQLRRLRMVFSDAKERRQLEWLLTQERRLIDAEVLEEVVTKRWADDYHDKRRAQLAKLGFVPRTSIVEGVSTVTLKPTRTQGASP